MQFVLVVDDLVIKYVQEDHALHLINALKQIYEVTEDWQVKLFCGIHLNWNYEEGTIDMSMPDYVNKALEKVGHKKTRKPTHTPSPFTPPKYGKKSQEIIENEEPPLTEKQQKRSQ